MFINAEDAKRIQEKVTELQTYWNSVVADFGDVSNKRKLTSRYNYIKVDIEDLTMEVKFETGWDDDSTIFSYDFDVNEIEVEDLLNCIEIQIKKDLSFHMGVDADRKRRQEIYEEQRKQQRFETYKQLKSEFEGQ